MIEEQRELKHIIIEDVLTVGHGFKVNDNIEFKGILFDDGKVNIYSIISKEIKEIGTITIPLKDSEFICCKIANMNNDLEKIIYSNSKSEEYEFILSEIYEIVKDVDEVIAVDESIEKRSISPNEVLINILSDLITTHLKDLSTDIKETSNTQKNYDGIKSLEFYYKTNIISNKIEDYLEQKDLEVSIIKNANGRRSLEKVRQDLSKYLKKLGYIVRDKTDEYYLQHGKGYKHMSLNDVQKHIDSLIGENLISRKDLGENGAKGFITTTTPDYNIVMFDNCLFDMVKLEIINPDKPLFSTVQIDYKLNHNAKSKYLKEYLETSLKRETEEATNEAIKGLKQVVGYLFTSGNPQEALFIVTGIAGAGKSVLGEILTQIFGQDNTTDLKLQELNNNTHGTASLLNKHLNLIKDSDQRTIENVGTVKSLSGNEGIMCNPKNKDPVNIPAEEVPKTIITCNQIPTFATKEEALYERFVIIEFKNKIRGTNQQQTNLKELIFDNPEEIEWFIYESLKEYKSMIEKGENFIFRISSEQTKALVDKHQKPIQYLLEQVILKFDPIAFVSDVELANNIDDDNHIYYNDLNKVLIYLAKKEGLDIETNKNNMITPHILTKNIKNTFELHGDIDHSTDINSPSEFKEYKPSRKMLKGKRETYYPYLIAKKEYWDILEQIKE